MRGDAVKGRKQRRSMKDRKRFPIDRGSDSEGQNPTSACGVEQTHEWLRTSSLPGGCENLWAKRGAGETAFVTSNHVGAERDQTWGDSGSAAGAGLCEIP
jgi:hypothetical protein